MIGAKPRNVAPLQSEPQLEPWQQRVLTEKAELNEKIGSLAKFLSTEQFGALPEAEQDRLTRQLESMTGYRSILTERINSWASVEAPEVEVAVEQAVEVVEAPELPEPGTV